jgi:hypothetical protein
VRLPVGSRAFSRLFPVGWSKCAGAPHGRIAASQVVGEDLWDSPCWCGLDPEGHRNQRRHVLGGVIHEYHRTGA